MSFKKNVAYNGMCDKVWWIGNNCWEYDSAEEDMLAEDRVY